MYMATAETGVAVVAEVISEGKVLDTGVDSLPSLGLVVVEGMLKKARGQSGWLRVAV